MATLSRKVKGPALALAAVIAAGGVVLATAPNARADVITITIGDPNSGLSGYAGAYATVKVDRTSSTTAEITFSSLTNGGYMYLLGGQAAVDLNVNGSYSLGTVAELNSISGFTPSYKNDVPGNVAGFGPFNLSLNNNDGFTDTATSITVPLTNTSGTWSSASDVLTPNSDGAIAAVHAFACAEPGCSSTGGAATTGFARDGTAVPEPGSLALLGTGLVLLAAAFGLRRRARGLV